MKTTITYKKGQKVKPMKFVYILVGERSDEPCAADLRAFSTLETAKVAIEENYHSMLKMFDLTFEQAQEMEKSFQEHDGEAFSVVIDESDFTEYYCRIECVDIEDLR